MEKLTEEDKRILERMRIASEAEDKKLKHFIEVEYPQLPFKSKVNYWYSYINDSIRNTWGRSFYKSFTKKEYKEWKKREPEIDKILKEVMKSSYILGINKRRFYFRIGKYWKVLFP